MNSKLKAAIEAVLLAGAAAGITETIDILSDGTYSEPLQALVVAAVAVLGWARSKLDAAAAAEAAKADK